MSAPQLVEHFFRHEYGRLVAILARHVGVRHLASIEDAVQSALKTALETWPVSGLPDRPSAWLLRVAKNNVVGELRQGVRRRRVLDQAAATDVEPPDERPEPVFAAEVEDDLLRMLFVCCDEAIPVDAQLVLALKILCGFDVREIASRLFISEANVYKRLGRARARLRAAPPAMDGLDGDRASTRLPAVRKILYLLFTEGHLSNRARMAIRRALCNEAIRLTDLLANHPHGQTAETHALLALMYLHAARLSARRDASGALILLEDQARSHWDGRQIAKGLQWLARSARGDVFSRYHGEAAIAAEHCLAPSFGETRWDKIAGYYARLEAIAPSPLYTLNRALAVAEWRGPAAGLAVVEGFQPPTWLEGSYWWTAVLADLHRRCDHERRARRYRASSLETAPTPTLRALLERRLSASG